jgi:CD109 antigen
VEETLAAAAGYLDEMRSVVDDDPYSLSIGTVALRKVAGFESAAGAMLERLVELASGEGAGIHWEPYPVETTGYAAMALLAAGRPEASAAVDWLSTQRNALGGYGVSTQDTVVAIRALFLAARQVRRDLVLDLALTSGSVLFWSLHVDETNFDVLHSFEVPSPQPGEPPVPGLELAASGSGSAGFQVVRRYNVPGESLPPPRNLLIEVEYDTHGIEVDDLLDVTVRLLYTGMKDATAMVIADVGVPTGFEVVRPSLDALLAARTASRYEIAGRKVIFYFDSLRRNEPLELGFPMRALYPVRAAGPVSLAYEYYDADVLAYQRMGEVIVSDPAAAVPFVRGDTNADGRLDVTDAVGALSYLFLGGGRFPCLDAIDTDDDGGLDLGDPVHTLDYLFLGGPPPAAPYPDCGLDTTPGGPGCESFPACGAEA